jgi:hypothetical protein
MRGSTLFIFPMFSQKQIRLPFKTRYTAGQLLTSRMLQINGIFFPPENYGEIREFIATVQAGDEQQAVLSRKELAKDGENPWPDENSSEKHRSRP